MRNVITSGVVADICIGMLAEVTAGLEFCPAAFGWYPMECVRALQAWMPSYHVW